MKKYEDWAIRVSRLLELIAMDNDAITMHTEGQSPKTILEQYEELRNNHLAELSAILKEVGIAIQLLPMTKAT